MLFVLSLRNAWEVCFRKFSNVSNRMEGYLKKDIFHLRILFPPIPFFPPIPSTTVDKSPPVSPGTAFRPVVFQAPLFFFLIHQAFLRLLMTPHPFF